MNGGGGAGLLLQESCHFDSCHQGNGLAVPQSSALSGPCVRIAMVCVRTLQTCTSLSLSLFLSVSLSANIFQNLLQSELRP